MEMLTAIMNMYFEARSLSEDDLLQIDTDWQPLGRAATYKKIHSTTGVLFLMCGIFGWFGQTPDAADELVPLLSRLLQHRGPDDQGYQCGLGWGFGFRRLSILDLSPLGSQPMSTPDGRFWIVFNGEIYNYLELREDLERKGEHFRGGSDTEVLLRLLACDGVHALERLNGMFALALVDTKKRAFLLARDRLGVKPLYY